MDERSETANGERKGEGGPQSIGPTVPTSSRLSGVMIKPPQSFAHKVSEALRSDIVSGIFRVGERLPTESDLCSVFGVSRAVVREAISALKQEGFVISFQGRGIFVADRTDPVTFRLEDADLDDSNDLRNILDFLIANEVAATELAAINRTEQDLREIRAALDAIVDSADTGSDGIEEDLRFHMLIIKASRNPYFVSFTAFLENRVRHLIRTARSNSAKRGLTSHVHDEHVRILSAIERGDRIAARAAAETHLRKAAERLKRRLAT